MSQGRLHNIIVIETMFLAGVLIATGGALAMIGATWNAVILVANLTGCSREKAVTKNQFNTIIITKKGDQDGTVG